MKFQTLGNTRQFGSALVKNTTALTVQKGAPVYYKHDTTSKPGLDVLTSEGLSAINQKFFAGIVMAEVPTMKFGDAFAYGFYDETRIFQRSRAAITDDWPTAAAIAVGDLCTVMTQAQTIGAATAIFQCFSDIGANGVVTGASSATDATAALTIADHLLNWVIRAAESFSSTASQASSVLAGQLVSVVNLRCLIRAL